MALNFNTCGLKIQDGDGNYIPIQVFGVPGEVADWLDEHPEATTTVQDGSITLKKLADNVTDKFDEIDSRINAFTHLEEGSTTGDAELIDGRIAYDGMVYSNIGDAIRTQVLTLFQGKVDGAYVEDGYLYLTSGNDIVAGPLGPFSGGGGGSGGGTSNEAKLTVSNTTGWLFKAIMYGRSCPISLSWSSIEDEMPTGNGTVRVVVNNITKAVLEVAQGEVTIDLGPHLGVNTNNVKVTVSDVYGNGRTISYTVNCVAISLESSFDGTLAYSGPIIFPYTPNGNAAKTMHFILDGTEIASPTTTATGKQQTYTIPAQTHGMHTFRAFFDCVIGEDQITSNELYYELICTEDGNTSPIISANFLETTAEQHTSLKIPYVVYDPENLNAQVTLSANGAVVSNLTVDRTEQSWVYRADEVGELVLTIACRNAVKSFTLNITESEIDTDPETDSLVLHLSSYGRNNQEEHPDTWAYEDIECQLTGFNHVSDGWQTDENGDTVLRVAGDARVVVPYKIFKTDFRGTGKTIELEFATRDVMNYDAVIMDCLSGGRGIQVTAQKASFASEGVSISTQYKENEHIRVSFVIQKRVEQRLVFIFINGIASGVVQYPNNDDFSQITPVDLTIGSNDCTVDLYNIRVYDNDLTRRQIVDNWIADTADVEEKIARYTRNNIFDANGNIVLAKLPSDLPYLILEAEELPQYKGDKKTISGSFVDPLQPSKSFTFENAQFDVQGTSSQYYERKNYKAKFKGGFIINGTKHDDYRIRSNSIPTDTFCFKADVASSEGANNVELAILYNDICPYKTPYQVDNPNIRQGIDGFPMVVFWNDGEETRFLGKYNWNNDKGTEEVFGFNPGDESWEIKNNTSNRVLWKSDDYTGDDWLNDFEGRYPDGNTDPTKLKELATWLKSTDQSAVSDQAEKDARLQKFHDELADHMEVQAVIFYYLFTELFLMVDSRAKNAFPTFMADSKWFSLPYDFDTAIGINNEGALTFGYQLEDIDQIEGGANVFNGQDSVLWVNLRQAFFDEIRAMYQSLRSTGKLSYAKVEKAFEDHQAKWSESIFNEDAWFKYVDPLIDKNNGSYLSMLQGSKAEQRKWWLYNRFRYMDSKYNAGDAESDVVTLRGYAKADIALTPYADVYASIKYGSYLVQQRANRGQTYTLANPLDNVNDTEIYIYSASQISQIGDLSGLKVGYADFTNATKVQALKLGDSSTSYSNGNMKELYLGNNTLLKTLDVRNCALGSGNQKAVDISGCTNIEEIYFDGTQITGITLPDGGIIKKLHLPGTLTNLTIKNQKAITEFIVPSYANITTLWLENVSPVVNPLAILAQIADNSRVRLTGIAMEVSSTDEIDSFYGELDKMRGLDENGNNLDKAVVEGAIHIGTITGAKYAEYRQMYPYITIEYDHISCTLNYYNFDGSTLLNSETVLDGGNGTYTGTPARAQTAQYTFAFVGWNTTQDARTADANATKAVTADRDVYAAYSATVRTYTVTWENANGTVLETDQNVPYGTTPTFNGSTPTYDGQTSIGWNPDVSEVVGDITYTANYKPKYTVRFYNGTTLLQTSTVIEGQNASYTGSTPTNTEGTAFLGWSRTSGATTADANALKNITANTDIYAVFEPSVVVEEITDSWDTIAANIDNGTYKTKYKIGNYKPLDLGTEGTVNMQIVAMDADTLPGGGTAPLSMLSMELLETSHRWNPTRSGSSGNYTEGTGTIGGWEKSEIRAYLNDTILPLVPANVRSRINAVTKYSRTFNAAGTEVNNVATVDKVWLPSMYEMFGSLETLGVRYSGVFPDNASRIKHIVGAEGASYWWLRSANDATNANSVDGSGGSNNNTVTASNGVAFGFCFGLESETISDSLSEIKAAEANGTYTSKYSIGDTKEFSFGENGRILAQIAAFDADELADGTGNAKITWMTKYLMPDSHRWNPALAGESGNYTSGTGTIGGYDASEIKSYLASDIVTQLPQELRDAVVPVTKYTRTFDTAGSAVNDVTTTETFWLASRREMFGSVSNAETQGPIYSTAFPDNASRIKKKVGAGSASSWWLRSAAAVNAAGSVTGSGGSTSTSVTSSNGVAFGFCT